MLQAIAGEHNLGLLGRGYGLLAKVQDEVLLGLRKGLKECSDKDLQGHGQVLAINIQRDSVMMGLKH